MRVLFYNGLLLLVFVYATLRGGRCERASALIYLVGSLLTRVAHVTSTRHFASIDLDVVVIDLGVLAGFVAVALKSDRYWPIWIAALQLIEVLAHLARLMDPGMLPWGYAFLLAVWAYPILALIAFATWRHDYARRRMSAS